MSGNTSLNQLIIEGIQERKGLNITIVDMSHIEYAPTPCFIIAQGNSSMQVASIADSVREYVFKHSAQKPYNYDGYTNSEWIVVDYGSVLVHVFVPQARLKYNLEELWSDAIITDIPNPD